MVAENIYLRALSFLSKEDQAAIAAYQEAAQQARGQGLDEPTVAIEDLFRKVPTAERALRHYDRQVGRLLRKGSQ